MKLAYTKYAKYYDLIFSRNDYVQESKFIRGKIKKLSPDAKSVLDIGCGTGEHLSLLKDDFDVLWGVDLNPEIIDIAKTKSDKIKYQVAGMQDFTINDSFDVVLCLYSVFNYNLTREEAVATLKNFKKHLKPKGIMIFSLYAPHNTEKAVSLHLGKDDDVEVAKINQYVVDPKTKLETADFLVLLKTKKGVDFEIEKGHKYRIYDIDEFAKLCKEVGFSTIDYYEGYTDIKATKDTKYPVAVIQM